MKDSKTLLDQLAPKIAPSQSNLATAAGHPDSSEKTLSAEQKAELIDAINECFELLRLNYQHLYFSAYPEMDAVNSAKRLWLEHLSTFSPDTVRQAIHHIIKTSDYLPTISRIVKHCVNISTTDILPDAHSAYIEACRAPSPKQNYLWSHPAVYYAGKQSDWFFLSNNSEHIAFPVFKANYEKLCEKLAQGEALPALQSRALTEISETPLSKQENSERLAQLRKEAGI